jgi:energy-converting hydrogenase B subunit D
VTALQLGSFVVVAVAGTAVVLTADPLRQALVLGIYGFALTVMFFALQAPDVALSEIVVSGVGLPLIILAALRKLGQQERSRRGQERER